MMRVKIDSMAFGGSGVGRIGAKVIFVPGTLPNEEAWVEVVEERKSYLVGRAIEILTPSPWRIHPPCPYFGTCGGCQWQHIDPKAQENLKKEILIELLQRIGGLKEIPAISVAPSSQPFEYRIRIQLKVEGRRFGFYGERSRRIVEVDRCLIAHPLINLILRGLRDRQVLFAGAEEIEINISPDEGKGILILHTPHSSFRGMPSPKALLEAIPLLKGIALRKGKGWNLIGDPTLRINMGLHRKDGVMEIRFRISPGSFFQVNPHQNLELIRTVLAFANLKKKERVADLYSGIGNFTLPLAMEAAEVTGIEENRIAVSDARFNAEANGLRNCRFLSETVEQGLKKLGGKMDLVVLDPPRAGCKKIVGPLVQMAPEKIIYVSCDPATFSRDVRLLGDRGYVLQQVCLIEMFPQTYHTELVGLILRS